MEEKKRMSLIADEIQKLRKDKDLKLTIFGAICLSPFSKKVILKSRDKFRQVRGSRVRMDKPFNYFLALCMETAKFLKEEPNWNKNPELCEYYSIDAGFRVTEDDEFLSNTPLLVKKTIDALLKEHQKPTNKYKKESDVKRGPQFSGETYVKYGKTYLKPKETTEWQNPEIEERIDKEPEYWDNEKRKFIEMAKEGKVNMKGIEWLLAAGILSKEDVGDMVKNGKWNDSELSGIIETMEEKREEIDDD